MMMKIALIQITSGLEPTHNLEKINNFLKKANEEGAQAAFLPEVFYSISNGTGPSPYLIEESKGEHYETIRQLAKTHKIALIGGSCATRVGDKIINRAYNFDSQGVDLGHYDKNNLFAINMRGKDETILDESSVYTAGKSLKAFDFEGWRIGLSICFDLRYPEIYRTYFKQGVNLITVASAFTVPTGKAHWEVLLRARAIENQSYVVASNQVGQNNTKISTWGHSMIISPWGEVLLNLGDKEGIGFCELDLAEVEKIRNRINVMPKDQYLR